MDFDWTDKVAETLTIIFNDLISRLDHKDSLFFEDLSEIIFNGLMPRGCRSELTDEWSPNSKNEYGRKRANLSTLAKESLEKVANALQDELGKPGFELFVGSHNPRIDKEIEAGIHIERALVDKAKLAELAGQMNTSATDRLTSSFYLRPSTSLLQYKKLFGKCKTPLQVYYQFPEEKKWHLGFLLYFEHKIYFSRSFFELSNDPLNFQYSYHTFESDIVLHDCSNPYISIKRRTDKYPLKLATSFSGPVETPAVKSKNVSSSLEFLYFVLFFHSIKAAPGKDKGSEADETEPIETCGLSKLTFKDINVKFVSDSVAEKFKDNHLYLGIKCYPYTEYVKLTTGDDNSQNSKIVFLPLNNWFRKIEFSLLAFKTSPILNGKALSLGNFSLLNYDILTTSSDLEKNINEDIMIDPSEKIIREATIEYKAQNLSSYESYLVDPNKNNYMEGKKMIRGDLSFSKTELKIAMFRFRRCLNIVEIWTEFVNEIFRFKYSKWSYFIITIFHIVLYAFNMNYLLINFLLMILVAVLLSHRKSTQFIYENIIHNLRKPEDLNTFYWEPIVHTKTYLKTHRYLQIELLRKKLKPADGIVSDLKLIKLGFNSAPFILHALVNMFEKVKNLITWYEAKRTKAFMAALVLGMVVFYVVPFKLFVLAWRKLRLPVWKKLSTDKKFYENHLTRNKLITVNVLSQILVKYCDKYAGLSFDTEFPFLSNESEFSAFRKKLIPKIDKHLDIELPDNLVKAMTKMNDLVNILASTNERLKILEPEPLDIDPKKFEKKVSNDMTQKIKGFINTTPTDFFDIIYNS